MALTTVVTPALLRHFPHIPPRAWPGFALEGALNERYAFQVALRQNEERQRIHLSAEGPRGWSVRIRRVGLVPLAHLNTPVLPDDLDVDGRDQVPGFVPDPLFDDDELLLPENETHAFWLTVEPADDATAGLHEIAVTVTPERGEPFSLTVPVKLYDVRIAPRRDFAVTTWFYCDALIDWYGTDLFDARFWEQFEAYVRDVVAHGQDTLYVPTFTPPLDGVKSPSQLIKVSSDGDGGYALDWSDVKRYIDMARGLGIRRWEWCHPFTQWGAKHAIRIYEGQGREENLLWPPDTGATSDTYRGFLAQYLDELHQFLVQEDILDDSFFHISDEPHGEDHLAQYRENREMLRELAPWMRVMDALTEIEFGRQGLTDMPIPSVSTALDFHREGIPSWCYYCCGPRGGYVQHLMDTPLPKIAMHGFLFYRWPFQGFLHWGYNYWYRRQTRTLVDPYVCQDGQAWADGWAYGDTFFVYPGPDGPVDSIRWELFATGLQDYALLQTLGVERDDPLLAPIESFCAFPKTAAWRLGTRRALLERATR